MAEDDPDATGVTAEPPAPSIANPPAPASDDDVASRANIGADDDVGPSPADDAATVAATEPPSDDAPLTFDPTVPILTPPGAVASDLDLEAKLAALETRPGVYLLRDRHGHVIYVGKAKSLRSRVR